MPLSLSLAIPRIRILEDEVILHSSWNEDFRARECHRPPKRISRRKSAPREPANTKLHAYIYIYIYFLTRTERGDRILPLRVTWTYIFARSRRGRRRSGRGADSYLRTASWLPRSSILDALHNNNSICLEA